MRRIKRDEVIHHILQDEIIDKIEIGPANNRVTIHGKFDDKEDFQKRIDNAAWLQEYANKKLMQVQNTK